MNRAAGFKIKWSTTEPKSLLSDAVVRVDINLYAMCKAGEMGRNTHILKEDIIYAYKAIWHRMKPFRSFLDECLSVSGTIEK